VHAQQHDRRDDDAEEDGSTRRLALRGEDPGDHGDGPQVDEEHERERKRRQRRQHRAVVRGERDACPIVVVDHSLEVRKYVFEEGGVRVHGSIG
jgi:hypothetical protein